VVNLGAILRCTMLCGHLYLPQQKEEQDEKNVKDSRRLGCDAIHMWLFRNDSARRLCGRILPRRPSSSPRLRLSEHGRMSGRIIRDRRHVFARSHLQNTWRCFGLSTKAVTLEKRVSSEEGTGTALIGRPDTQEGTIPMV
jgi:hypothetical protein